MILKDIINNRRTIKVLSDKPWENSSQISDKDLTDLIEAAGQAPFHYPVDKFHQNNSVLNSIVPWRLHILEVEACRELAKYIIKNEIKAGKILQMLHVADCLIQFTWLPDQNETNEEQLFRPDLRNMEHIAGASAAVQNLLLTATEKKIPNYWSSGGVLRQGEFFDLLNIPKEQILLGSVFLFPEKTIIENNAAKTAFGGLREKKGHLNQWSRKVTL